MKSASHDEARSASTRRVAGVALAVAFVAGVYLFCVSPLFQPGRLHIQSYYVDQGVYVTTARTLVDEGVLRNGIIYPAFVENDHFRTYMPGHYLVLAASYAVLGARTFAFLLPNLLAFVLSSVVVFWIGQRFYGIRRGLAAALLFMLLPANALYAFTAMAEGTFTAAGLLAFAAFLLSPRRLRPWLTPLLLALPFLFRETGALYVLPMAAFLLHPLQGSTRWKALAACVASVGLLAALNAWQLADGKGEVPLTWVTDGRFNYDNAYPDPPPDLSPLEWAGAFLDNAQRNFGEHGEQINDYLARKEQAAGDPQASEDFTWPTGLTGLACFLLAIGAVSFYGIRRWRTDPLPLGAALIGLCLLGMIYLLYDVKGQKAMRSLLFTWPLFTLALAGSVGNLGHARSRGPLKLGMGLVALVLLLWWQMVAVRQAGRELVESDEIADSATGALQVLHTAPDTLLVAPFEMLMNYAVEHYPVRCAFLPYNDETLALLSERWVIGTLVMGEDRVGSRISHEALHGLSLKRYPQKLYSGDRVYVPFQRR